jgi:biofilm PGA synthesis N-glycosyltransferase PgaC
MKTLFWLSLGLLFYIYFGYPTLVAILARIRSRPVNRRPIRPTVSLLIAAHNEECHIQRKLENLLDLEYPRDRLEIVVTSDGSTDRTVEIARGYESRGVKVLAFDRRRGKPSVLNNTLPQCKGEIIVLSDARQLFNRKALIALVENFSDPSIGAVSGELFLTNDHATHVGQGLGFYWWYEKLIRRYESRIDSTVGTTGAMYAIRRNLFEPIPPDTLLDDVLIPMRIVRGGYRVVFESEAVAYDQAAKTGRQEFARKVRTIAGNLQLFTRERWLWNPRANRLWFQAISHKALRILGPPLLAAIFAANLYLIGAGDGYRIAFGGQLLFYAGALAGSFLRGEGVVAKLVSVPYAFCLLNATALVSIIRLLKGTQAVTWEKASEASNPDPSGVGGLREDTERTAGRGN